MLNQFVLFFGFFSFVVVVGIGLKSSHIALIDTEWYKNSKLLRQISSLKDSILDEFCRIYTRTCYVELKEENKSTNNIINIPNNKKNPESSLWTLKKI